MLESSVDQDKIIKAFRSILCRKPKQNELDLLLRYFESEKRQFGQSPEKANHLVNVGEYRHEPVNDLPSLAALMQVIQTLYNMDEAITKS
jgi:hypothetical protein